MADLHPIIARRIAKNPRGTWCQHPGHPLEDWKYEVSNDDTRCGYHEWASNREYAGDGGQHKAKDGH